jgi:hypothetical protein
MENGCFGRLFLCITYAILIHSAFFNQEITHSSVHEHWCVTCVYTLKKLIIESLIMYKVIFLKITTQAKIQANNSDAINEQRKTN